MLSSAFLPDSFGLLPLSLGFCNGTLAQSDQLSDKVVDQLDVQDLVQCQLADPDPFHQLGHPAEELQVFDRLRVQWVHKQIAEDGEKSGHWIEKDHPADDNISSLLVM